MNKQPTHARLAEQFNQDEERVNWHDETLWFVRQKRDKAARTVNDWEALREQASQIKDHVLSELDTYLLEFEARAKENGIQVHWAADASEHNAIVHRIFEKWGVRQAVKSKSMLTEECHLNQYLAEKGIEVIDSDLGERIVQLANEAPSHIVLPAIHKKKEEVGALFHQHLGSAAGESDAQVLTETARQHLRQVFLTRKIALTGVNFAVAETGEFVVCTNEGNADMGAHLADVHIACMGIEKIIPRRRDLGVFLRLLARSATGQPITTYSSHFKKPRPGQEMHLVLLDNGRSRRLGEPSFRNALKCIRCGACMNTCPVYRRSGGHSYHYAIAGPIGAILAPGFNKKENADLPFASTLCGSCTHVCPVKINIHEQLYQWRQVLVQDKLLSKSKQMGMQAMSKVLASPTLFRLAGKSGRSLLKYAPFALNNPLNPWCRQRDLPQVPAQSFAEWYRRNRTSENQENEQQRTDTGKTGAQQTRVDGTASYSA